MGTELHDGWVPNGRLSEERYVMYTDDPLEDLEGKKGQ